MKREVKWSTPKKNQSGWNKFVSRMGKRDINYCKKLKGDHVFDFVDATASNFWEFKECDVFLEYHCIGCGKKEIQHYNL